MMQKTAQEAYERAVESFISRNPKSAALFEIATQSLPAGNTRASVFYHPFPVSISKAKGARLYDADGHEYVDMLGDFTAGLYGHSEPIILEAISKALERGLSYGGQHEDEAKLAELIKGRFPSMDLLRFTNSGTEANLLALQAATAYTGKKKVVVFAGGYHGATFLFKNGHNSPINVPHEYLIAKYNDISSVQKLLNSPDNFGQVAAIILEPMMGSGGAIPADRDFLLNIRQEADKAGAILIFDEVMTSRMHDGGGIQGQLPSSSRPDMTTLGKYFGGGLSFGCFGGTRSIMEMFDLRKAGALAHAGTFNNNVLSMTAGNVALKRIFTPERAKELHAAGEWLRKSLQEASRGSLMKVTGYGSILCFHFTRTEVEDIKTILVDEDTTLSGILHLFLLEKGYYISRQGFMTVCLALTREDMQGFVDTVKIFLEEYRSLVFAAQAEKMTNGQ